MHVGRWSHVRFANVEYHHHHQCASFISAPTVNLTITPDSIPQGNDTLFYCEVEGANVTSYRFYAGSSQLCEYDMTTGMGQCQNDRHSTFRAWMVIFGAELYEDRSYTCQASTSDGTTLTSDLEDLTVIPRENITWDSQSQTPNNYTHKAAFILLTMIVSLPCVF